MATLSELEADRRLWRLDPQLLAHEQEVRLIYATPRFVEWLRDKLPGLGSTWDIDTTPLEQVDELIARFCRGDELAFPHHFHAMRHAVSGVWELKSADVRIFGWFVGLDCFVADRAGLAELIKESNLYHGLTGEVLRTINEIDLDHPKSIPGEDPHAVVSNYYCA